MISRAPWLGILCGLLTAIIWGVQSVVSRHAMLIDMTPADVTILRFVSAAAVLLPWALRNMRPFPVGSLGWPRAWVMALLIGPLYSLILVGGAHFAPALHSSIISPGLIPVFTALLIFLVTGERAGPDTNSSASASSCSGSASFRAMHSPWPHPGPMPGSATCSSS